MDALALYRSKAYGRPASSILPYSMTGWMQPEFPGCFVEALVDVRRRSSDSDVVVFEVGSWQGYSTTLMASEMRHRSIGGTVVAIDTWLGSPEHIGDERLGTLYDQFVSNVMHRGLEDLIVPFRISSAQAGHFLESKKVMADIVYIDAGHEYESVKLDADIFWRLLKPGGYMIFDDYPWGGVQRTVNELGQSLGISPRVEGALAMVQKPIIT
jgi:predicted O-methyltransferase YrrM